MTLCSSLLSILLVPVVAISPLLAQLPTPPSTADSASPMALQLRVLGKDPSSLPAGTHSTEGISVEVTDASGSQVSNAAVVFRFPDAGPSATFGDGTRSAVAYTDGAGRAQISDIQWGNMPGSVALRITAAKGTSHAGLLVEQTVAAASLPAVNLPIAVPLAQASTAAAPTPAAMPGTRPNPIAVPSPVSGPGAERRSSPGVTIEHRGSPVRGRSVDASNQGPAYANNFSRSNAAIEVDAPDANVPLRHAFGTGADAGEAPGVSITSAGPASGSGHSKKKWILILAAAAGAGAAGAMLEMRKGGPAAASSGLSIGAPTVSVGHP